MNKIGWKSLWSFLVLFGVVYLTPLSHGYEVNKCYCWDEMNSTLKDEIASSTPPSVPYQYTGAKYLGPNTFQACACKDVTRVRFEIMGEELLNETSVMNETALASFADAGQMSLKSQLNITDIMSNYVDVKVYFTNKTLVIEVVAKGREVDMSFLEKSIKEENINENELSVIVLKCEGEPKAVDAKGSRAWLNTDNYPGDRAQYFCNAGYFIVDQSLAYSECLHFNLSWSEPKIDIKCEKGCQSDPPRSTFFAVKNWNPTLRNEGSVVNYTCMNDYRSVNGDMGISTCTNSEWTEVDKNFKCEMITCTKFIPQVPAHGRADWDKQTVFIGTNINYYCIEGYSSTIKGKIQVTCNKFGNWTSYPPKYDCVNNDFAIREGFYDDQAKKTYDYYEDGPVREKKEALSDELLFWFVTIPSMFALLLLIICCFCVTRTNSPIFVLCTGNSKYTSYIPA